MLIESWMTKDVLTLTPDRSMMKASKLMKDNNISRIPIVDEAGELVGIISDRDIKDASPSKATTLDMHELYYLLSEIKIKDIMTKSLITVRQADTVEKAAVVMLEKNIGGMPVVDDAGKLMGIITQSDIFKVLIEITGVRHGGAQFGIKLSNEPGTLVPLLDFIKDHGARVMSILTSHSEENTRHVFVRIRDMDKTSLNTFRKDIEENFAVTYWTRDVVESIIS